jgi:hypothetical protein
MFVSSVLFYIQFSIIIQAREGQFYGAQLEGYAYYTCLRDNRLVPEGTQCPPWCLNLTVTGKFHLN